MKQILIDTNIYTHAMKGDPDTIFILQRAREIGISAVSIGELLSGVKGSPKNNLTFSCVDPSRMTALLVG